MIDILSAVLVIGFSVYLLLLRGRAGHPDLRKLKGWAYAHRGLHNETVPENSMAAFSRAVEAGYGMELDVHLMADGKLAVIHDSSLKRTAGVEERIENLSAKDLPKYKLQGTEETIPLFTDVLEMVDGRTPLIVEIKTEDGNHKAVTEAVCSVLKSYKGAFCVESFDPRAIKYVKKHYPNFVRGQLAHNSLKQKSSVSIFLRFMLTYDLLNFLVDPDFIAYRYSDRKTLSNFLCRRVWGVQGVSWTLTDQQQYDKAVKEGWIPIFEQFTP